MTRRQLTMDNDTQVCVFSILLFVVIILYIYGMYKMTDMNSQMLRGGYDGLL